MAKMQLRVVESARARDFAVRVLELGGFRGPTRRVDFS